MNIQILTVKKPSGVRITCPEDVYNEMQLEALADREHLWIIHLNPEFKIIEKELAAIGTHKTIPVIQRLVFRKAVLNNASYIIIVHNHPFGSVKPSEADAKVGMAITAAGQILGIRLLDSIIIGPSGYFSTRLNEENGPGLVPTPHEAPPRVDLLPAPDIEPPDIIVPLSVKRRRHTASRSITSDGWLPFMASENSIPGPVDVC